MVVVETTDNANNDTVAAVYLVAIVKRVYFCER